MAKVRISAARFSSLLANRNLSPDDIAARVKTGVSPHELASTDIDVEFADLIALSKEFGRPWSYLLIDETEHYPSTGRDNRTFENRQIRLSAELLLELQSTEVMLETAAELFPGWRYQVPKVVGTEVPAAQLAPEMRALLGVTIDTQLATKDDFAALRLWIGAIHEQGVYVAQRRLSDKTIRAFSQTLGDQAVIVVDTRDTPYARIFSALHEYCHVTLRSTGICDLDDHTAVERYCNEVAARVLLPSDLLDQVVTSPLFAGAAAAADDELRSLSRRLHVSQAALLIRLRDHGSISQDTYEAMEHRRAGRKSDGGKKPGGTYYPPAINRVGRLYAHRVVDAVNEGIVDRQDASALLGIGEHLMSTYVSELVKGD